MPDGAQFSWRWLNTYQSMGSGEWIYYFTLVMCAAFGVPNKLSLAQVTNFLILLFCFSPWSGWWGGERAGVWGLVIGWGETTMPSLFLESLIETSDYLTSGRIHLSCREGFGIRGWFREYQKLNCHMEDSSAGIMGPAAPSLTPSFFHIHSNYGDAT